MSTSTPDAEIISAYKADLTWNYFAYAALTIVCYEFLATFRREYMVVWKRRWTGATWLFLANRYLALANIIILTHALVLDMLQLSLSTFSLNVFSALRVFTLLGRSYILAAFTFALGLAPVALSLYQAIHITWYYVDDPVLGSSCYSRPLISPSAVFYSENYSDYTMIGLTHLTASLAGVLSTIAADVVAITITWVKTYHHVQEASSVGVNVGFSATLLRYGTLYFIVLFIVNLIDGLVVLEPSLVIADPLSVISQILPSIILSRLLINLRQINAPEASSAARFSRFSPPNFRMPSISSTIGNLGEPLADHEDDVDDEEHVVAEAYEDGAGAGINSGEEAGTSVMNIGAREIEEVRTSAYLDSHSDTHEATLQVPAELV
ncbi:hypothetical protein NM688_g2039 [Phlebia brevispora]|uniref:Uncharacterized protein n=1 Tax=Phlebia brevispora TaxID=194682 RepID=A0ACC1T9I8_9APHY|nr:hypothetical protein NM688_g2039 [Phlebia brevispora]